MYHDHLLPLANQRNPDTMASVNNFFKGFSLPLLAVPKGDEALPREGGSGYMPDGVVP